MGIATWFGIEIIADNVLHFSKTRALTQQQLQLRDVVVLALGNALHVAVFQVADKATEVQFMRMMQDEPAKADTLDAPFDEKVDR